MRILETISMAELKANSIRVTGSTLVHYLQEEKDAFLNMREVTWIHEGHYAYNNSTLCFVHEKEVFVTPYTRIAMRTLKEAGLIEAHFYVPFSNWDTPVHEKTRWTALRRAAEQASLIDYEEDCMRWCDKHGLGVISEEALSTCLRIPLQGVLVKHGKTEWVEKPVCEEPTMDCNTLDRLGHYDYNNGVTAFVYRDGHTYVTTNQAVGKELEKARYIEGLFVPLSNGEQILDPIFKIQWKKICQP